jgi:hypothetical protein
VAEFVLIASGRGPAEAARLSVRRRDRCGVAVWPFGGVVER